MSLDKEHEVLVSSYLTGLHIPAAHHPHSPPTPKLIFPRKLNLPHKKHVLWCVLRRNQFSYYKDEQEREALYVVPGDMILNLKVQKEDGTLSLYSTDTTLTFRFLEHTTQEKWVKAIDEFMRCKRESEEAGSDSDDEKISMDDKDICENEEDRRRSEITVEESPGHDEEFYTTFDPSTKEHCIKKGTISVRVKRVRFNRKKWKLFRVELTNRWFKPVSYTHLDVYKRQA